MCPSGVKFYPAKCFFQSAYTMKIKIIAMAKYKTDIIIISLNVTSSLHDIAEELLISS